MSHGSFVVVEPFELYTAMTARWDSMHKIPIWHVNVILGYTVGHTALDNTSVDVRVYITPGAPLQNGLFLRVFYRHGRDDTKEPRIVPVYCRLSQYQLRGERSFMETTAYE